MFLFLFLVGKLEPAFVLGFLVFSQADFVGRLVVALRTLVPESCAKIPDFNIRDEDPVVA